MNITLDFTAIILAFFGILLAVISFFLKTIYSSFKELQTFKTKATEDLGKLKGQIELVHQEQKLRHEQIEKQTQLEIKSLAENVSRLTNTVEKLITLNNAEK